MNILEYLEKINEPNTSVPKNFLDNKGFSFRIYYPNQYKKNLNFQDRVISLVRVFLPEKEPNSSLLPIRMSIDLYCDDEPGSGTLSKQFPNENKMFLPVDITLENNLYYDSSEHKFYLNDSKVTFNELVSFVMKHHFLILNPILGIKYRIIKLYNLITSYIYNKFAYISAFFSNLLFGEKIDIEYVAYYSEESDSNKISSETKTKDTELLFSLGEYKVRPRTLLSFSILSMLYFFYFHSNPNFPFTEIKTLTENNFYSIIIGFLLLTIYDKIVRTALFKICKYSAEKSIFCKYKRIKISH